MGSDQEKIQKKRFKAQVKAEKARAKAGLPPDNDPKAAIHPESPSVPIKIPWHKDPNWVRAIIAIASFVVMVITLVIMVL